LVRRGELTDKAWEQVVALLPENGRRGQQWKDHRKVINGILWKLRTGAPWRDLPERYSPWQTCYDRFVRWRRDSRDLVPSTRRHLRVSEYAGDLRNLAPLLAIKV
jgi:hypothetical protein